MSALLGVPGKLAHFQTPYMGILAPNRKRWLVTISSNLKPAPMNAFILLYIHLYVQSMVCPFMFCFVFFILIDIILYAVSNRACFFLSLSLSIDICVCNITVNDQRESDAIQRDSANLSHGL